MQVAQIFTKQSKRNEGHTMQQHRPYWHMKVARYSFSGSIPTKFEHKLRRHKQTFGKIATTVVLDKDKDLSWSGLQWHWVIKATNWRHYLLHLQHYFSLGNRSRELFPPLVASIFVKLKRNHSKSVIGIFWDRVLIVRDRVKKRKILMFSRYL